MIIERKRRSVIKALSWRILATMTTMAIVFAITGKLTLMLAAGGLDILLKMLLYYFHERTWTRIAWGRAKVKPFVLWFTGLPASGKSTIANVIASELEKYNSTTIEKLDGHSVRHIFPKTGFSKEERNMHIKRVGFLASLLEKNGVPVICSFISPYRESRQFVRSVAHNFIEVHLNTPLAVCEKRDPKGLYEKARRGEIKQFTGIDDPYEEPKSPELTLNTTNLSIEECTRRILRYLRQRRYII